MFLNSNLQNERVEMRHILYVALVKITQLTVLPQLDLVMTSIYSKYYQHSFFLFFQVNLVLFRVVCSGYGIHAGYQRLVNYQM